MTYAEIYKICNTLAIKYLAKYSTTSANLKEYLEKKVIKIAKKNMALSDLENLEHEEKFINSQIINDAIVALIIKLEEMGYLNDELYAKTKVNNLMMAGKSSNYIKQKLQEKGINKDTISDVFVDTSIEDTNLLAIIKTIKVKKFFSFRTKNIGAENLHKQVEKEIASLFRQGFNFDAIKQVKDKSIEEIEELRQTITNNLDYSK